VKVVRTAAMVVGAAALIATGVGAIGALAAGTTIAAGTAATAGVSLATLQTAGAIAGAVATLTAKKPSRSVVGTPSQIQIDTQAGIPYAMGRTMSPGWVVHREAHGAELNDVHNPFQSFAMTWSLGPIEGYEAFQVDRQTVAFNGGGAVGDYKDWMWLNTQLGATPEAAPLPSNSLPNWGAGYKLSGHAAGIWTLKFDKKGKKFAAGVPLAQMILKGVKVYDPRLDSTYPGGSGPCRALQEGTYVWSENPWLHALTFALGRWQNGRRVMGVGMPVVGIDVPAFVEAANIADANGWKIGGVISSLDDKWNALKMMAQAGGGEPIRLGAKLSCIVSAPRVSLATITAKDIVGPSSVVATQPRRDRINGIIPRIRSEAHGWEQVPLNVVRIADYVTADGGERTRERDYQLVQQADQAAELAAYEIVNAREFGPVTLPLKTLFMGYKPGDCLTLDDPEIGLNSQPAVIVNRSLDPSTAVVTVDFKSETPAKHDFALGRTGTPPPTPSLTPPDLSDVAAPSALDWTLTGETLSTASGAVPALLIVGVVGNPSAEAVVFEYRPTGEEDWRQAGTEDVAVTRKLISPVAPDASYEAAVSYRVRGVVGERLVLGPVGAGELEVPWTGVTDPGDGSRPEDGATVGAPPGTPVGDRPAEQVIDLLDSLDASYALVVAAVEDVAEDAADAREDGAAARAEAGQVRIDLSAEVLRAQEAEGAIYTLAVQSQITAEGAVAQITDAVTILAEADAQLAARQTAIESENDALDARITTEEATRATQIDAVASRTLALESSFNGRGLIGNPGFGGLTNATPPTATGWTYWNSQPTDAQRFDTGGGRFAWVINADAGQQTGINSTSDLPMSPGWHVVEASWNLADGVHQGAAVFVSTKDALGQEVGTMTLPLTSLKDSAGKTVLEGDQFRVMRTATLVNFLNANIKSVDILGANNIAGAGQGTPYKQITWRYLDIRPATPAEIEVGTTLPLTVARITEEETTRATETGALANRATALETSVYIGANNLLALRGAVTDEATTRSTADTALSNRLTTVEASAITGPNNVGALRAAITDEQTARATADTGLANRLTTVEVATTTGPNSLPALRAAVTDEATARIDAVGSVASRTTRLEASAGGGGLIGNPGFMGLSDATPPALAGWAYWNSQPTNAYRFDTGAGRYAWVIHAAAGQQTGVNSLSNQPMSPGWHVVEVEWNLADGVNQGAAVHISPKNALGQEVGTATFPLTSLKDSGGKTVLEGDANRVMRTATLVNFLNANIRSVDILGANNFAFIGQGTPYKQITWRRLNIRAATPEEIAAGVALPALEATVQEQAGVLATHEGKLGAYWEVEAVAGGRARIRAHADATGSAIDMAADVIVLGDQKTFEVSAGRARVVGDLYVEGGNLIIRGTSHMKVLGLGFGASGEFVEWYGPLLPSVAQCSRANGVSWETKAGAKKLGGFSIGQLVAGTTNPALAASVTASTGAFGSNGGIIQANASWYYRRVQNPTWPATTQGRNDFIAAMQAYGATDNGAGDWSFNGSLALGGATTLQMRRNGSNVATQTVSTGTRTIAGHEPEVGGAQGFATISDEAALSFTYTDPQQIIANRTYEAVLTRHAALAVPTEQTVSIATIE
jgi:hypothetical protein